MTTPLKVLYDLTPFAKQQESFHSALSKHFHEGSSFPIIEILTLLPINFHSDDDRKSLLARGNGKFDFSNDQFKNESAVQTSISFDDYMLGLIEVTMPNSIVFNVSESNNIVTLDASGSFVRIDSIENLVLPGNPSIQAPFSLVRFEVGSKSMLTMVTDKNGTNIIIDAQIRSNFDIFDGGFLDQFCEKDWVLLQDDVSKRCILVKTENPVRRYPKIDDYDTKEEAVRGAKSHHCNGLDIIG